MKKIQKIVVCSCSILTVLFVLFSTGIAAPLPGGTLDPLTIPKYVTPLVIPPVMDDAGTAAGLAATPNNYDISVRQFKQQILPGGIWNTINGRADAFPATTVWSYGPASDPVPAIAPAANSQFNYPSYTIESTSNSPVNVRWRNELVAIDPVTGYPCDGLACQPTFLPHLLPIDQTLHWANPPATGCMGGANTTDCMTMNPAPYTGPVPIITHVHGAHVDPHSDGYPEAWWLPAASNIPAGYSMSGSLFDDATGANAGNLGYADFFYRNDQPAATIWYHDHSLGMTRSNVYAGPAGFWLIRGGIYDGATDGGALPAVLPGPAPVAGQTVLQLNVPTDPVRRSIREIPIAIQDRSFNIDGSLFYPASRAFFDGYLGPYVPTADIAPIWNPEAFFNTMVVNGVSWPSMEVAPALYRLRLLNGCNSRFLNLSMFEVLTVGKGKSTKTKYGREIPFYQIGAEQGFLRNVVMISTGLATPLPGNGTIPAPVPSSDPARALLMGLAERADVIVDFRNLPTGTRIRMLNTGPDAPFGGFPAVPVADPNTSGQVMEFVVNAALLNTPGSTDATATPPQNLVMNAEPALGAATVTRQVSLNEEMSGQVCVTVTPAGNIKITAISPTLLTEPQILAFCAATKPASLPMAPKAAVLGKVNLTNPAMPLGIPLHWTDTTGQSTPYLVTVQPNTPAPKTKIVAVSEDPVNGATEDWQIYNFTIDSHPIHIHLIRFEVVSRTAIPGIVPAPIPTGVQPTESGYKDSVIAYPGEITTVRALYDVPGLYVWHCHIVEHEDNEMMRPYIVQ